MAQAGTPKDDPKQVAIGCVFLVVIGLVTYLALCGHSTPPSPYEQAAAQRQQDSFGAQIAAEEAVKLVLKAPGTARFGDEKATGKGNGAYEVRGWVDSQNNFGAKLRNRFIAKVRLDGDTWHSDGVELHDW
jgi:hypothetical protein